MKKIKGKIVQIIKNNKLKNYMITGWIRRQVEMTGLDLVVVINSDYPKGWKGYFLSFRKDCPEESFSVLVDATAMKVGDVLDLEVEKFRVESFCYIEREKVRVK